MITRVIQEPDGLYLSEGIQEYGYLLISDLDFNLVSASENCQDWMGSAVALALQNNLWDLVSTYFPDFYADMHRGVHQVLLDDKQRLLLEVLIHQVEPYFLNIYIFQNYLYLEFERKMDDSTVFFPKFEIVDKLLKENKGKIWEMATSYISKISGFDRIRVFQYGKDGSGHILAECIEHPELEGILDCYYPDIDIYRLAKNTHVVNAYRYTAKVNGKTIKMISNGKDNPNLSHTGVRMIAPLHADYLLKDGVNSNLSVSLFTEDGDLWGYLFCQSRNEKKVNLVKREALVYFVQMAMNRFLEETRVQSRLYKETIRDFELKLKSILMVRNNLAESLYEMSKELCYFAKADSMIILFNGLLYSYNINIGLGKILGIKDKIATLTEDFIFGDHEFILNYGEELELDFDRFAGVGGLYVEVPHKCTILWFRQGTVKNKKWIEKPEKIMQRGRKNEDFVQEENPIMNIWHQTTFGTSEEWEEDELYFFHRLRELIINSEETMAAEITNLNQEVSNLNKALDDYANMVSHDLKNPLSAINLSTQMLLQRPEMAMEMRNKMLKNTKDAVVIINDMLSRIHEFSKVKEYDYKFEPVYVDEFLPQLVEFCKLRYEADKTEVVLNSLIPVYGEKTIIYQLFQNIVGNAIKYSAKSDNPCVRIEAVMRHEFVCYSISDNGIGIAKEEIKNVFDNFKRMSNASDFEGSGLGLTIVKRIVDRLGIQIEVESELNVGTTIYLWFPNEV